VLVWLVFLQYQNKGFYFFGRRSLADNASMKAYMGSGFTPLVVQRNKTLYFDIAERLTKQAQLYLNAQGEERQILVMVLSLCDIVHQVIFIF
jgi:hypothetical protein